MSDELDSDDVNQTDHDMTEGYAKPPKETVGDTSPRVMRDPVTGKFLAGTKAGPGRPKGLRDRLNVQVIETLEALWSKRGAEIIDQLAAERPEVVAQLIARMIPQQLAAEAITGESEKAQSNQEVTVRVITQQHQDVLPPREVEGELMLDDTTTH